MAVVVVAVFFCIQYVALGQLQSRCCCRKMDTNQSENSSIQVSIEFLHMPHFPYVCMYEYMYICIYVCMATSMYCLYVGFDYTYIDITALAQGNTSFLASQVWFQAVYWART